MAANRLTVGNVEILPLSDGEADYHPLKVVFPDVRPEQWAPYRERYPAVFSSDDRWHIDVGCYLIRSHGRTLLVDTGSGPLPRPMLHFRGKLLDELRQCSLSPEDVDTVFLTHAHYDHVGWNLTAERTPVFANARYLLHHADWQTFQDPEIKAQVEARLQFEYIDDTLTPLRTLGILDLLDGERALTPEVTAIPTPGHTPGHMSLLISSAGEKALITGDAFVHPVSITEPDWQFAFDREKERAVATRKRLLDRIESEGMTVLACHFPEPGYGHIVRLQGRRYWQAL